MGDVEQPLLRMRRQWNHDVRQISQARIWQQGGGLLRLFHLHQLVHVSIDHKLKYWLPTFVAT